MKKQRKPSDDAKRAAAVRTAVELAAAIGFATSPEDVGNFSAAYSSGPRRVLSTSVYPGFGVWLSQEAAAEVLRLIGVAKK